MHEPAVIWGLSSSLGEVSIIVGRSPTLPMSLVAWLTLEGPSLASPLSYPLLPLSGHRGGAGDTGSPAQAGCTHRPSV